MFHTFSILILFILTTNTTTRSRVRPGRSSEPKISSRCYDHLGCVDINEKWYDSYYRPVNLDPLDRHTIRTEFLYMKPAKNNSKDVLYDILTLKYQTLNLAGYKRGVYTFFLIHDFTSNGHTGWIKHIALGIAGEMEANVISVDWEPGAEPPLDQAVANARVVALEIELFIKMLKEHFDIVPDKIHLVGHGVGAHIAGYVGKSIKGINRITGLDPTGPRFENMPCIVRLDPDDAKYVEVLHTEAFNSRSQGTLQPMGHSDFYMNNAGHQPGCNEIEAHAKLVDVTRSELREGKILPACSHKRAFKYYISAITTRECKFVGIACSSYETFLNGSCSDCDNNLCASFDFCPPPDNVYKTKFFVNTHSDPPFCMYAYQVNISIESNEHSRKLEGHFEFILTDMNNKLAFAVGSDFGGTARSFIPGITYTLIVYAPPPAVTNIKEAKVRWRCKSTFPFLTKAIYVKYIAVRRVPMMGESAPVVGMCPETGSEIKDASYIQFVCCDAARIQEEQRIATMTTTTTIKTTTVPITTTTTPAPINVTWPLPNETTTTVRPPTQCLAKEAGQAVMTPGNVEVAHGEKAGPATPAAVGGSNGSLVGNMIQANATSEPADLTNKIIFDETPNATTPSTSIIATMASTKKEEVEEEEEEIEKEKEKHTTSETEEKVPTEITTMSEEVGETISEPEGGVETEIEGTTIKVEAEQGETISSKGFEIAKSEETTTAGEILLTPKEEFMSTAKEEPVSEIAAQEVTAPATASPRIEETTSGQISPSSVAMVAQSQPHTEQQIETTVSSAEVNPTTFAQEQSESISESSIAKQTISNAIEGTPESQSEIGKGMEHISHHTHLLSTLMKENVTFSTIPVSTDIPEFITPKSEESTLHRAHNETETSATEAGEVQLESTIKASTMMEKEISPVPPSEGSTAAGETEIIKISEGASETCTEWNSTEPDEFLEGGIVSESKVPHPSSMRISGTSEGYITMVVEAQVVTELITEQARPTESISELSTQASKVTTVLAASSSQARQPISTTHTAFELLSKQTAAVNEAGITGEAGAHQEGKGISSMIEEMTRASTGGIETERGHTEIGEETAHTSGKSSETKMEHSSATFESISKETGAVQESGLTGQATGSPELAMEHSSTSFEAINKQTGAVQGSELTESAEAHQASKGISSILEGQGTGSPEAKMEHSSTPFEAISKQTGVTQGSALTEKAEEYQTSKAASPLPAGQETGSPEAALEHSSTPFEAISKQTGAVKGAELSENPEAYQAGKGVSSTLEGQQTKSPGAAIEHSSTPFEAISKQTGAVEGVELTENAEAYQAGKGVSSILEGQEIKSSTGKVEVTEKEVARTEAAEGVKKTSEIGIEHLTTLLETINKQTAVTHGIEASEKEEAYQMGKTMSTQLEHETKISSSKTGENEHTEVGEVISVETEKTPVTPMQHLPTPPEIAWEEAATVQEGHTKESTSNAEQIHTEVAEGALEETETSHETQTKHLAPETTSKQAATTQKEYTEESTAKAEQTEMDQTHTEVAEGTPKETERSHATQTKHLTPETTSKQAATAQEAHREESTAKAEQTEVEHTHTEVAEGTPNETERSHETQTKHLISETTSKQAAKVQEAHTEESTAKAEQTEVEQTYTEVAEGTLKETESSHETQTKHLTPETTSKQAATVQVVHAEESTAKAEQTEVEQTHTEVAEGTPEETERSHETQTKHLAPETTSKQAETEESSKEIERTSEAHTERLTTTQEATTAHASTERVQETEKGHPQTEVAEEIAEESEESSKTQPEHLTTHHKEIKVTKGHSEATTKHRTTEKLKEHIKITPARKETTTECATEDLPECEEVEDSADFGDDETSSPNSHLPEKTTPAETQKHEKENKMKDNTENDGKATTELLISTSPKNHHTVKETHHVTHPEHTTGKSKSAEEHKNKTASKGRKHRGPGSTSELPECDELEV